MSRWFLPTSALLVLGACAAPTADETGPRPFVVAIEITSDPGHGLGGAELLANGERIAATDDAGRATLSLDGNEGDSVELAVRCPAGFQAPTETLTVSLRRFAAGSRAPSFGARCAPQLRTVVIGIRAENGPNLPVVVLGKEVGRTDSWGAAHIVLSVKPNEPVAVLLDTKSASEGRPRLRPENPTLTFVAKEKDDMVVLDQKFDIEKPPPVRARGPTRGGPTRI